MYAQGDAVVQFGQYPDPYGERNLNIIASLLKYFSQLGEVKRFMSPSHWKWSLIPTHSSR